MDLRAHPKKVTMASIRQTTFARSAPLPFVISTEAKRSGEISVWMLLLGNVFQQSIDGPAGPPKKMKVARANLEWMLHLDFHHTW